MNLEIDKIAHSRFQEIIEDCLPSEVAYNLLIRKKRIIRASLKGARREFDTDNSLEVSVILYQDGLSICDWYYGDNLTHFQERVKALWRRLQQGEYHREDTLPRPGFPLKRDLKIIDERVFSFQESDYFEILIELLDKMLQLNSTITSVDKIQLETTLQENAIYHSSGFAPEYTDSLITLEVEYYLRIAGELTKEKFRVKVRNFDQLKEELQQIKHRGVKPSRESSLIHTLPAVFRPSAGIRLLELFYRCINPDKQEFQFSGIKNKIGRKIAHSQVDIFDDGLLEAGVYTVPYDDEGINSQSTPIVNEGKLRNILTDNSRARLYKASYTGNGFRQSGECTRIRATNFYLVPSHERVLNLETILNNCNEIEEIEILDFSPEDGQLNLRLSGNVNQSGEYTGRFNKLNLKYNLYEFFQRIDHTLNDLKWQGHFGMPTVIVEKFRAQ